jgi:hypothetical protein
MALIELKLRDAAEICRLKEAEKQMRASEAISPELFSLTSGDAENPAFRRITSPATLRDLNPVMHQRMQQVCFFLFMTTPFGKRIIRVIVDYIVGEGFKAIAEDPALQDVINGFWQDPYNNLDEALDNYAAELLVFGELCLPVAVNPVDGSVRLGYIDPQEIDSVEFGLMQTASSQEITVPVAVNLRQRVGESKGRRLTIIRRDEDANSAAFGQLTGDCFYFAINKCKSASRGISELFSLADWIDVFDGMVFDFADRIRLLNSFVWHYIIKGGDAKAVEDFKNRVTKSPPRQGGVEVTNEMVTIEAHTPDLRGTDMSMTERVVKNYGLGGAGLPPWFFGDAGNTNRATADEMAGPTGKMLTSRQNAVKRLVTTILDYAIEHARAHSVLPQGGDSSWKLQVPDLRVKDMAAAATALQTVANASGLGEDRGWIRAETAARAFHTVLTQIGVDVGTDEFDKAQAEKAAREANQQNSLLPQSKLADALKRAAPATGVVQ